MNPHEQDPERPLGWLLRPLLRVAFPEPSRNRPAMTPEVVAHRLAEPDEFAVEAALRRGWCTDPEADRWALHVGRFPWEVWPSWLTAGLHPVDLLWSIESWWRPAWSWAHDVGPTLAELAAIESEAA